MRSLRLKVLVLVSGVLISLSAAMVTAQVSRGPVRPRYRQSTSSAIVTTPKPQTPPAGSTGQRATTAPPVTTIVDPWRAREAAWQAQEDRINRDPRAQVWGHPMLRIGQDLVLKSTDTARNVAVIFGSATIEGFVDGDVFVWLGETKVTSTAVIRGSVVTIGGNATIESGAVIRRDLVVVGGVTDAAAGFLPGGDHFSLGAAALGDRIRQVVPWITHGLLWGRPLVPNLGWTWWVFGLFFVVHFLVNLVFHDAVSASAKTLAARPLSTFMAGLLVLLLTGPLAFLLVISVIGTLVVPFALCALAIAWIIGKTAVERSLGGSVVRQESADSRPQSMRSFLLGAAVILLLYMIPIVGLMTWGIMSVFGLGSAVLAFFGAIRRENPAQPKPVKLKKGPPPPVFDGPAVPLTAPPAAASYATAYSEPAASRYEAGEPPIPPAAEPPIPDSMPAAAAYATATPPRYAGAIDLTAFPRATFLDRLAAFALDLLLVFIVSIWLNNEYRHNAEERFFLMLLAYYVGFWTWKGTTVGGIICNLRVVRADGERLRFVDAVVRGLSGVFSILALGLGGLWILRDPDRQAWHDKISATYVVKVPRTMPLP